MAKNKDEKQAGRREEILAAAATVFGAKGYAAATVDEIAAEAGVSKGTTYNYFQSKQDLYLQLFQASIMEDEAHTEETVALAAGPDYQRTVSHRRDVLRGEAADSRAVSGT